MAQEPPDVVGVQQIADNLALGSVLTFAVMEAQQGRDYEEYASIAGHLFHITVAGWPPKISVELVRQ